MQANTIQALLILAKTNRQAFKLAISKLVAEATLEHKQEILKRRSQEILSIFGEAVVVNKVLNKKLTTMMELFDAAPIAADKLSLGTSVMLMNTMSLVFNLGLVYLAESIDKLTPEELDQFFLPPIKVSESSTPTKPPSSN